ncbi:enoyl-CoA hydratase [Bradyrhizobium sp. LHD-71]|uniref:enoyl-CoA hydratase n=1 Tax=Bradyrhizobium sp. LHD-71 TaxID=3072141 RepID=UPI00280E9200|nr:enoyl-CoA hydratase [Bradyrhizobium sp. LHD-71]MDQ8730833.1 enoyl-CoA hydratase [Bradyrhizobium sp. LHD-71]
MSHSNPHARLEIDNRGVAQMTICNAGSMIIFNSQVIAHLRTAIEQLGQEKSIRALVLRGDSEKAFVGGADIKEMAKLDQAGGERFITGLRDLCEAVRNFPQPVIARIPGWCLGGGLEFAICCDFRIASDEAQFAMPEVKVGIPSVIHAAMMPRVMGTPRARWLVMTGATIDAATALQWGLVDVVTTPDKLDAEIEKVLGEILECGAEAIAAQKVLIRKWEELPLKEAIDASIPIFGRSFLTGEPQHHMQKFIDRPRKPKA